MGFFDRLFGRRSEPAPAPPPAPRRRANSANLSDEQALARYRYMMRTAPPETIDELEREGRVVFRYCSPSGDVTDAANPNGSLNSIAGICSERRNVVGLMPHPERACELSVGSSDGLVLFESVVHALTKQGTLQTVAR